MLRPSSTQQHGSLRLVYLRQAYIYVCSIFSTLSITEYLTNMCFCHSIQSHSLPYDCLFFFAHEETVLFISQVTYSITKDRIELINVSMNQLFFATRLRDARIER